MKIFILFQFYFNYRTVLKNIPETFCLVPGFDHWMKKNLIVCPVVLMSPSPMSMPLNHTTSSLVSQNAGEPLILTLLNRIWKQDFLFKTQSKFWLFLHYFSMSYMQQQYQQEISLTDTNVTCSVVHQIAPTILSQWLFWFYSKSRTPNVA